MTTKEEALRLAEFAGFQQVTFNPSGFTGIFACVAGQNLKPEITKLIDLAKQAGAAEEREACLKICEDFNQLAIESRTRLSSAFECAEAIRNRGKND